MDKINTQKFNLSVKKSDISKNDDVLGALFSLPILINEKKVVEKTIDEYIVNPSIDKVISSKKSSKSLGKLEIMFSEFFSKNTKNKLNNSIFNNDDVFEFNSKKIPNILKLDIKSNKILKNGQIKQKLLSKINYNDENKDSEIKINFKNQNDTNFVKSPNKLKSPINSTNPMQNENAKKNFDNKENLNKIFSKIDYLKEDIISNNIENKIVFHDSEIIYKKLKINNENNNYINNSEQLNKVENINLRNNSSHHQFNSDKNMNFILDQLIEELDMSKLGWTEKLILRIEKGLKEEEKLIELALKPKELGNLKINLKLKDKGANITMKVENAASMIALQSNEALLSKTLSDQGFTLEKINFENSLMGSNKENNNSSENNKNSNHQDGKTVLLNDKENNKDDNLNYIININA